MRKPTSILHGKRIFNASKTFWRIALLGLGTNKKVSLPQVGCATCVPELGLFTTKMAQTPNEWLKPNPTRGESPKHN